MLSHRPRTIGLILLACALASGGWAGLSSRASGPSGEDPVLETWWVSLEKGEAEATRALLKFSARPQEAVGFFARRLKPLKIEPDQVRSLLEMLKSDKPEVWKPAFEHLEYFDPRLAIDLQTLMQEVLQKPARQRMVEVLSGRPAGQLEGKDIQLSSVGDGFNFFATPNFGSWWAEHKVDRINSHGWNNIKVKWTRAVRVVVLLEHIRSPEAIALLTDMATGHPEAEPTRAAKEALDRIAGKIK